MSKIAVVIPEANFRDEELFVPLEVWKKAGIETTLFSTTVGEVVGDLGGKATPQALLGTLDVDKFDAIAVIGGSGTITHLWENAELRGLLLAFEARKKLVTSICAGSVTLARAGLLSGKAATTYPVELMINELKAHGALYSADHAIRVGNIVTGDGPDGAGAYANMVVAALQHPEVVSAGN
ncbi:DJ-1/PfpI family protein [Paraburkholderia caribensis]|uniref:DJ-1/PfpI family protein n=1 Tax=Paraburkholderia caribensis TaxID=75105 RepID=UPI001591E60E|nr:DJ-1/PfpI family protein [Paraburkholderia caribensis]